jgi:uncharacterized protein YgiM (DUF1202 family)
MNRFFALLLVVGSSILLSGCSFPSFSQAQSGVSVDTSPGATVYVDGQQVGSTPYENKRLKPGEISLRLVPQTTQGTTLASWEGKIRLTPGIQTIIRRVFGESLAASSGVMLTFDKLGGKSAALSVVSVPDAASVKVDGQYQGFTPVAMESIPAGDHQILLSAPGYQDQLVSAKAMTGYRLIASAQLAQLAQPPTATPTPGLQPIATAKPSATPKASGTPKPSVSPTPKASPAVLPDKPYVQILDTPTGYLRVRAEPSTAATELTRVNPGEAYPYKDVSSDNNWFQIEYKTGSLGWVSAQYAKKVE